MRTKAKGLVEGSTEQMRLEQEIERIFNWLKTAPTEEVVVVSEIKDSVGR
jgi:hypothetical protein